MVSSIKMQQGRSRLLGAVAWYSAAFLVSCAIAWFAGRHVDLLAATSGFSPVGMMHPVFNLPGFAADFSSGEEQMMTSLIGRIYRLLGLAGASDQFGAMFMIWLETACLMAGAQWLARSANPHLPFWTSLIVPIMLAASTVASANFARFGFPFYGSVYNFAFGIGLAAIAATLTRRMVLAGSLIGIVAMIHPILALFSGVAMATVVLADWRSYSIVSILVGGVTALLFAASWYLIAFRNAGIAAGDVDVDLFLQLTRLNSFHWFPLRLGVFGERAWEVLLPFSAVLMLWLAVSPTSDPDASRRGRQLWAAAAALLTISLAGVVLSESYPEPVIVKLALHRASLLVMLIAAAVFLPRLADMALNRQMPLPIATAAVAIVFLPFICPYGVPIVVALGFTLLMAIVLTDKDDSRVRLFATIALGLGGVVIAGTVAAGHLEALRFDTYKLYYNNGLTTFAAGLIMFMVARYARQPAILAVAVGVAALLWTPRLDGFARPEVKAKAEAYLDAQLWARNETPVGSVFMVDPLMFYSWRQYSQRPSFGTPHEWLYASWIYDTKPATMREGIRRASLLGIQSSDFEDPTGKSAVGPAFQALMRKADTAFNTMDAASLAQLAHENGIAYFVFDRSKRGSLTGLEVLYQNDGYIVAKPL